MQQTAIDRWLRKKFIYITRVYCNTLPNDIPPGMLVEESPEESGGRFLYKLSTRSDKDLAEFVEAMSYQNITYTSRVEDRPVWYARYLNNPHKSVTYQMIWVAIGIVFLTVCVTGGPQKLWAYLTAEEVVAEEIVEAPVNDEIKVYHKRDSMIEIDSTR